MFYKRIETLKVISRVILVLWAGFWLFFAVASSIAEGMPADLIFIILIVLLPLLTVFTLKKYDGVFSLIWGLFILISFPLVFSFGKQALITDLMLSFCPIISGILLIIYRKRVYC